MATTANLQRGGDTTRLEFTERWMRVLELIANEGPKGYQRKLEDFAGDVQLPVRALTRMLRRMEDHGAIKVVNGGAAIGVGAFPNRYICLIEPVDWRERAQAIVAETKRKAKNRKSADRKKQRAETARLERRMVELAGDPAVMRRVNAARVDADPELREVFGEAPIDVDAWALDVDD